MTAGRLARTSIEGFAFTDERFGMLALELGLENADYALIRCARLWSWQTENYTPERPTYVVNPMRVDVLMGLRGASDALVKAELAELHADGIRIRGSVGRIEWLYKSRQNGALGGRPKKGKETDNPKPPGLPLGLPPGSPMGLPPGSDLRSEICDLRSQSEHEGPEEHATVPSPPGRDESAALRDFKETVKAKAEQARADKAARIPERAWKAADYFRQLVLEQNPTAALRNKPWEGTSGIRFNWARDIALLVERDGRTYEQIAEMLRWLFNGQTGSARFVVLCPDTLRDKWDRIAAVRGSQQEIAVARKPAVKPLAIPLASSQRPKDNA